MVMFNSRRKTKKMPFFVIIFFLVFAQVLELRLVPASSQIDITTAYPIRGNLSSVTNKTTKDARLYKSKITTPLSTSSNTIGSGSHKEDLESQQTLIATSSKSYVSAPSLHTSKLAKRVSSFSGTKRIINETRNATETAGSSNNLQKAVTDHIPNPSNRIPYRIGRPHYPSHDYGSSETVKSNNVPYDADKWRHEYWDREYNNNIPYNTTRVQHIEAECQDDYMKIRIGFNDSFSGLLYSAGYAYDPDCIYINGSGRDYYEFYIQLNRCGTLGKNALNDEKRKNPTNFMWNTITVQYNPLIEEEFDEHFKVTCEYGYDFWKTVTFPFLDVEVATGNPVVFTLSPPECYMEIQNGYGIGGPRVTGPVRVGDPLTLIIYMRSKYDGFDIVVNDCYAHNGANKRIQLIDEYGCPVDDKLISRFRGSWSDSGVFETQVYAYMKTFRFTGSPALYIECDVRMCHGRCPSQPCHWRNLKAVTKRDVSNATKNFPVSEPSTISVTEKTQTSLSENINLFQSLRVLQEGETDNEVYTNARVFESLPHQTCLKTSLLSTITIIFSGLLCILIAALMITCSRLKYRRKETPIYDATYINHKGQID